MQEMYIQTSQKVGLARTTGAGSNYGRSQNTEARIQNQEARFLHFVILRITPVEMTEVGCAAIRSK